MINISGAPPNSLASGPPAPSYYDNYSGPANPACFLTLDASTDWAGQSFTTSQSYYAKRIDLWIKKGPGSNIGNVNVEIYNTLDGHPQVPVLNSGVIANADVSEDYSWVSCTLDFYLLSTSTKYCIVVHGDSLDVDNTLIWACGGDGSGLPNGDQEWSINSMAGPWSTNTTRDQLFRCYPMFLQECYNNESDGNNAHGAYENFEIAQTFTPQNDFTIKGVRLYMRRKGTIGNVTVGIYETIGGHPFGPALCSAVVDGSEWDDVGYDWIYWEFSSPVTLPEYTKFAIWLSGTGYDTSNCPDWRLDSSGNYIGGTFEMEQGAGWVTKADWDCLFETWSL